MTSSSPYTIPAEVHVSEITVVNSRFITTIAPVFSVEEARAFLSRTRASMPHANHHVYAFRVGHGNSVTEGLSDDGEPSGTAGPPVMAVLRGTHLGDIIVIVTRYFGGTKLGTGGLVRAYSDAARTGLSTLKTELKIAKQLLGVELPYHLYEPIKRLIKEHGGSIEDETFAGDVTVVASFAIDHIPDFTSALQEATAGRIQPINLGDS